MRVYKLHPLAQNEEIVEVFKELAIEHWKPQRHIALAAMQIGFTIGYAVANNTIGEKIYELRISIAKLLAASRNGEARAAQYPEDIGGGQ